MWPAVLSVYGQGIQRIWLDKNTGKIRTDAVLQKTPNVWDDLGICNGKMIGYKPGTDVLIVMNHCGI